MTTPAEVIAQAASWAGFAENPPGSNRTPFGAWYGIDGAPWCGQFVSYVFWHAGLPLPASTTKGFAYTPAGADWFRRQGRYFRTPQVGDVVFFYWLSAGRIAHCGIVERVEPDGSFYSWEGNTSTSGDRTGGRVLLQHRALATVNVDRGGGFGRPSYTGTDPEDDELTPDQAKQLEQAATKANDAVNYAVDAQKRLTTLEAKVGDGVNYDVDAQKRLVSLEAKVDAILAKLNG